MLSLSSISSIFPPYGGLFVENLEKNMEWKIRLTSGMVILPHPYPATCLLQNCRGVLYDVTKWQSDKYFQTMYVQGA